LSSQDVAVDQESAPAEVGTAKNDSKKKIASHRKPNFKKKGKLSMLIAILVAVIFVAAAAIGVTYLVRKPESVGGGGVQVTTLVVTLVQFFCTSRHRQLELSHFLLSRLLSMVNQLFLC
jgi:hypothetical protein